MDGDTIRGEAQKGATVEVTGRVRNAIPVRDFPKEGTSGRRIVAIWRDPMPVSPTCRIHGYRAGSPYSDYLPLSRSFFRIRSARTVTGLSSTSISTIPP